MSIIPQSVEIYANFYHNYDDDYDRYQKNDKRVPFRYRLVRCQVAVFFHIDRVLEIH